MYSSVLKYLAFAVVAIPSVLAQDPAIVTPQVFFFFCPLTVAQCLTAAPASSSASPLILHFPALRVRFLRAHVLTLLSNYYYFKAPFFIVSQVLLTLIYLTNSIFPDVRRRSLQFFCLPSRSHACLVSSSLGRSTLHLSSLLVLQVSPH